MSSIQSAVSEHAYKRWHTQIVGLTNTSRKTRLGVKATTCKAKAKAKDLTFKAKAKDLTFEAKAKDLIFKAKAKDLTFKAKAKDLIPEDKVGYQNKY